LREAAAKQGITLTEHATAIARASVERLDCIMEGLRTSGPAAGAQPALPGRTRAAATASGPAFMYYGAGRRHEILRPSFGAHPLN
jgi:hypothetical protein